MSLTNKQINKLKELRGNGFTQQEIADELNISRKTVENNLRKLRCDYVSLDDKQLELIEKGAKILSNMLEDYVKSIGKEG